MESPLSLETQSKQSVRLGLLHLIPWDVLDILFLQKFLVFLFIDEVFGWDFVKLDIWSNGEGSKLLKNVRIFFIGILKHMRSEFQQLVVESLDS